MENYVTKNMIIRKEPGGKLIWVLFIFAGIIIGVILFKLTKKDMINPVIDSKAMTVEAIKIDRKKQIPAEELKKRVSEEINKAQGTYSVYYYDLLTGDNFGINEQMIMTAASVTKIPILASVYHLGGKGELDLDKLIVPQAKDIQDYGTGTIRYDKPGTAYSIKTLARLMMEKSDNTAAYVLASIVVGINRVQEQVENWGLSQTDMKENKTSVKDMFIITRKIYNGEITTPELTKEMIGFMDDSDFEDRIPRNLPDFVKVYHKTGDEVRIVHDAGIIDIPERPYFLGIMTSDVPDSEETKAVMGRISQIVFSSITE